MKNLIKYIDARKIKYGFWDGEKAKLIDREHTIVRNKKWLEFLTEGSFIFYLYILLCYVPLTYILLNVRRWYRIKTGKLISLDKRH